LRGHIEAGEIEGKGERGEERKGRKETEGTAENAPK